MKKSSLLISLVIILFTGCAQKKLDFNQPEIQIPKQPKVIQKKKGALYSRQGGSLFADKKDLQVGDIIQVVINEALTNDSKNSRSTSSSTTGSFNGAVGTSTSGKGIASNVSNKVNSALGLNVNVGSDSSFSGTADTKLDESFATTISVIIEQTYQNGNYFIKGSKNMLIDGQSQEIIISGVIRPYDITPDNSISSSQVANLKILYEKDGEENDALHTPWGLKILKILWPF